MLNFQDIIRDLTDQHPDLTEGEFWALAVEKAYDHAVEQVGEVEARRIFEAMGGVFYGRKLN